MKIEAHQWNYYYLLTKRYSSSLICVCLKVRLESTWQTIKPVKSFHLIEQQNKKKKRIPFQKRLVVTIRVIRCENEILRGKLRAEATTKHEQIMMENAFIQLFFGLSVVLSSRIFMLQKNREHLSNGRTITSQRNNKNTRQNGMWHEFYSLYKKICIIQTYYYFFPFFSLYFCICTILVDSSRILSAYSLPASMDMGEMFAFEYICITYK